MRRATKTHGDLFVDGSYVASGYAAGCMERAAAVLGHMKKYEPDVVRMPNGKHSLARGVFGSTAKYIFDFVVLSHV